MWLIIILIIFLSNLGIIFINEEFIICLSLLLFFYLFFYNFKLIIKSFFFYKIEYIYFIFQYLINVNIQTISLLLININLYNKNINLLFLVEYYSGILIRQNFNKFNFILNLFLKKNLIYLIQHELNFLNNKEIIVNIENAYLVKYIKTLCWN